MTELAYEPRGRRAVSRAVRKIFFRIASLLTGRLLLAGCLIVAAAVAAPSAARAHEIDAAIADVTLESDRVVLKLDLVLEAYLAEIDLEEHTNSQDAEQAPRYDILRSLPPEEIEIAFRRFWPVFSGRMTVLDGDAPAPLELASVSVPPVGDVARARISAIEISAPASGAVRIGWDAQYGGLVLRQQGVPESVAYTGLLVGGALSDPIAPRTAAAVFGDYVLVGFDHIVPKGLDHILFVLGLFFFSMRLGPLLWQISAFTVAHTITLALAVFGVVQVAPEIVEPLIAASIVYVAVENLLSDGRLPWWRPLLVFAFGLLHGLGFASVLGDFGIPSGSVVPALAGFNVGVEFGQLAVVAAAYVAVGYGFGHRPWYRSWIAAPASIAIGAVGAYWVVERTLL